MIKRTLCFLNNFFLLRNFKVAWNLSKETTNWTPQRQLNFLVKKGRFVSKQEEASFSISRSNIFQHSSYNINWAMKYFVVKEENNKMFFWPANEKEIKFSLQQFDNMNAAHEIFIEKLYNFTIKREAIVFDVGANVGIAALYFAGKQGVQKVYAYEPFPDTGEAAKKNFDLNPHISAKIVYNNFGLGEKNEIISVPKPSAGFMGASTTRFFIEEQMQYLKLSEQLININLVSAADEILSRVRLHPERDFVLKLDCEGAEYGIVKSLAKAGILSHFSIIMIEWHFKGPFSLVEDLVKVGFSVFDFPRNVGSQMGMIYASK